MTTGSGAYEADASCACGYEDDLHALGPMGPLCDLPGASALRDEVHDLASATGLLIEAGDGFEDDSE